jgi:hypothetical protein
MIMAFILLCAVFMPADGLAQQDKGLQQAIERVRGLFDIPEELSEFDYNVSSDQGQNVWHLNWYSKDGMEGNMQVSIGQDGVIRNYYLYKPYDGDRIRRFPSVSRSKAQGIAEAFIEKVNPGLLANLRLTEGETPSVTDYYHRFNYTRMENGIPFYNDSVNIEVCNETGEVRSYYYNWTIDADFPKADRAVPMQQAQNAYRQSLGLRLIYSYRADGEHYSVNPVYVPVYGSQYCIDAFTGDRVKVQDGYYDVLYNGAKRMAARDEGAAGGSIILSPVELEAVEKVSKLLSMEEAERMVRSMDELEVTSDYRLDHANLYRDSTFRDEFAWDLSFIKEAREKDNTVRQYYISVTIDARDGGLKGYYRYLPVDADSRSKFDEKEAREAAEEFINAFIPDRFREMEFDMAYEGGVVPLREGDLPGRYSFRYIRKINDVHFPANNVTLDFDAVNGKVVSFRLEWYDIDFPSVDDVVDIDQVYGNLFGQVGLELQYKYSYPDRQLVDYRPYTKPEILLVYGLKPGKPVNFDAYTGQMLDYNGKPYKESDAAVYTDIDGHYAEEQITALAEYGISLQGSEFLPDSFILQKDYLILIARAFSYYYRDSRQDEQKELEQLYNYLIMEGVIKKEEKAPESFVTREQSVMFMIRALKYNKVADLSGIFTTTFKDEKAIDPALIGYVAIAKGMGIVSGAGGYFYPTDNLTRAQAAVMIYNYLNR